MSAAPASRTPPATALDRRAVDRRALDGRPSTTARRPTTRHRRRHDRVTPRVTEPPRRRPSRRTRRRVRRCVVERVRSRRLGALGADGEPLADWEIALLARGRRLGRRRRGPATPRPTPTTDRRSSTQQPDRADDKSNDRNRNGRTGGEGGQTATAIATTDNQQQPVAARTAAARTATPEPQRRRRRPGGRRGGEGNRRRRRRRKGRARPGRPAGRGRRAARDRRPDVTRRSMPSTSSGYLDIRDEGYGFLRVKGYLPSKEDAYIPLRLAKSVRPAQGRPPHRQGPSRPAATRRTPACSRCTPSTAPIRSWPSGVRTSKTSPRCSPTQRLTLEDPSDPTNMTARIIDLVSPIGKGQRGIIVSPPKAGKTTMMKTIAKSIELNNPEVILIVLLIDERPEEVTDMRRSVKRRGHLVDVRPARATSTPTSPRWRSPRRSASSRRARTS